MRIAITGGAGFIGTNFIHYILKKYPEYEIINLDKLTYAGNIDNLSDVKDLPNYLFFRGDICDASVVDKLVKECDVVVHFAAESHVDNSISDPSLFVRTNVLGTQTLLNAAVKYDIRFHHISTDEVFGSLPLAGKKRFKEDTSYDPSSPYSASKAASDHLVRAAIRTHGLRATITNSSNNYGPYQNKEKLIPLMIANALQDKKLPVYGNGLNVRDWVHVEDHCAAIDLVIHKGVVGETYLVGGNAEYSNLDIVKKILKATGKSEDLIEFVQDRPGHDLRYAVNSSKIEEELGWTRKYKLETGLIQTVEWYKKYYDQK